MVLFSLYCFLNRYKAELYNFLAVLESNRQQKASLTSVTLTFLTSWISEDANDISRFKLSIFSLEILNVKALFIVLSCRFVVDSCLFAELVLLILNIFLLKTCSIDNYNYNPIFLVKQMKY